MCVFMSLRMDKAQLKKRFDATHVEEEFFGIKYIQSAFEFAHWPVISGAQPDRIEQMNWGLIPEWVADEHDARKIRSGTVNARIETVKEKPSFRSSIKSKRCMILAEGFFEFRELNKRKYPYYIQMKGGKPFAIAGIYDEWTNPISNKMIRSFALLTTDANQLMEKIHNRKKRMPVILDPQKERDWLDLNLDPEHFAIPYSHSQMEAWPVSRLISDRSSNRNQPAVLDPFTYPELAFIDDLNI